jgi:hypothetical protein
LLATIAQALGLLTISAGITWIYAPAGLVALGISITLFGLAIERDNK